MSFSYIASTFIIPGCYVVSHENIMFRYNVGDIVVWKGSYTLKAKIVNVDRDLGRYSVRYLFHGTDEAMGILLHYEWTVLEEDTVLYKFINFAHMWTDLNAY